MRNFGLRLITREGEVFERDVVSVDVPAAQGRLTVLARHEPFVCSVLEGPVKIRAASGEAQTWHVAPGVMQVRKDGVELLVQSAARK